MSRIRLAFKKSCVLKMRACWLTFKKSMHFKHKYISFSNLSLFVSGQYWIQDVLKNKLFWVINKNPVLTVQEKSFTSVLYCNYMYTIEQKVNNFSNKNTLTLDRWVLRKENWHMLCITIKKRKAAKYITVFERKNKRS